MAARVRGLVLAMLEDLLARHVPDVEGDIADMVLDLQLSADDLKGAAPLARPSLNARLNHAVAAALATRQDSTKEPRMDRSASRNAGETGATAPSDRVLEAVNPDLAALLQRLFSKGATAATLSLLGDAILLKLLRAVAGEFDHLSTPLSALPLTVIEGAEPFSMQKEHRHRCIALLRGFAAARTQKSETQCKPEDSPDRSTEAVLVGAARQLLADVAKQAVRSPRTPVDTEALPTHDITPSSRMSLPHITRPQDARPALPETLATGSYPVDDALPVIALANLQRLGVIDAVLADSAPFAPIVLAAIAMKCLTAPSNQDPVVRHASLSAATGFMDPPKGEDFSAHAPMLDVALARAVAANALVGSLGPGLTLPLVAADSALILFDPAALSPVAEGPPDVMADLLARLDRTLFLANAPHAVWDELEKRGLALIGEGPPPQGSSALPLRGPNGWRGHVTPDHAPPLAHRRRLPDEALRASDAIRVWMGLTTDCPLVARPAETTDTRALERLAAFFAGVALADLSWQLFEHDAGSWRQPDPLLVRDRFAGFGSRIDVTDTTVTVILPFGRRLDDLKSTGALLPCQGFAGWRGRRIEFRGG